MSAAATGVEAGIGAGGKSVGGRRLDDSAGASVVPKARDCARIARGTNAPVKSRNSDVISFKMITPCTSTESLIC